MRGRVTVAVGETKKFVIDFDDGRYAEPRKRVTLFNKSKRRGGDDEDPERKSRETMKQKELEEKYKNWAKGITQTKQVGRVLHCGKGILLTFFSERKS